MTVPPGVGGNRRPLGGGWTWGGEGTILLLVCMCVRFVVRQGKMRQGRFADVLWAPSCLAQQERPVCSLAAHAVLRLFVCVSHGFVIRAFTSPPPTPALMPC